MDLTVEDVSKLLHVGDDKILNWINNGEIPCYQIQGQYRFNREEVEDWIIRFLKQQESIIEQNELPLAWKSFNLYRALHRGIVLTDIEGNTKEEVIRNSMGPTCEHLDLNAETMTNLLLDREKLTSTAINHGVAVPHGREFLISKPYDVVVIVYPKQAIDYGALDGQDVHSLFFLFACQDQRHLNLLAKIAYFCHKNENLNLLTEKADKMAILQQVRSWESKLTQLQCV